MKPVSVREHALCLLNAERKAWLEVLAKEEEERDATRLLTAAKCEAVRARNNLASAKAELEKLLSDIPNTLKLLEGSSDN